MDHPSTIPHPRAPPRRENGAVTGRNRGCCLCLACAAGAGVVRFGSPPALLSCGRVGGRAWKRSVPGGAAWPILLENFVREPLGVLGESACALFPLGTHVRTHTGVCVLAVVRTGWPSQVAGVLAPATAIERAMWTRGGQLKRTIGSGWLSDWIKQSRLLSGVEAAQLPLFRETEKRVAVFWMESIECGGGCLRTKTKKNIKEPGRGCSWSVAGGGPCHGTTRDLFTSGQGNLSRLTTCLHQAKFEIVSEKHARTYSLTTTAASAWATSSSRCHVAQACSAGFTRSTCFWLLIPLPETRRFMCPDSMSVN